jgi:predicted GNAT family N-acyltransferase
MEIRKSSLNDTSALMEIFDEARLTIAALGINQWQNGYPNEAVLVEDIARGRSYAVTKDNKIIGTFALIDDGEPTYDKIYDGHWTSGDGSQNYVAIHRVAIAVTSRGSGASGRIIEYAAHRARELRREYLRIDTHEGNVVMRRMLEKHGFEYCGVIFLESGDARVAYEKKI